MKNKFDFMSVGINNIRKEAKRLYDALNDAEMADDYVVKGYKERVKKAIFQAIDITNEIERNTRFLTNSERTASIRILAEKAKKEKEKLKKVKVQTEEYGSE